MRTYTQICLVDKTVNDGEKALRLKRGEEYITSRPKNGTVTVFKEYWAIVPAEWFGGAICFTGEVTETNENTPRCKHGIHAEAPCLACEERRATIAEIKKGVAELEKTADEWTERPAHSAMNEIMDYLEELE